MDQFTRFAVYVVPEGPLYEKGAGWLGWDAVAGRETPPQEPGGLPMAPGDLTATPARYGFHGTIKPPFRLAGGRDADSLREALRAFCAARAPIQCPPLEVRTLGRFVALVPGAPAPGLRDLANSAVEAFDPWRTPASEAELARRRKAGQFVIVRVHEHGERIPLTIADSDAASFRMAS